MEIDTSSRVTAMIVRLIRAITPPRFFIVQSYHKLKIGGLQGVFLLQPRHV
jgi:hypothetical protein